MAIWWPESGQSESQSSLNTIITWIPFRNYGIFNKKIDFGLGYRNDS